MQRGSCRTRSCRPDSVRRPSPYDALPQPPAQRRQRVAAEVVAVALVDGLEQQLDLEALELASWSVGGHR